MAEDEQATTTCFRSQKSEPGEGGVLCAGCFQDIYTAKPAYDVAIANAKKLAKQYS
ncbi:hypothetical protein AB0878_48420 [Amycolatopsis sp. NPDC047767]|uniref:hypothetical protein n=1 Tax=Amycolatopsis sp. NPDC047767 TaxID=3156765 RepID=UPI0034561173